MSQTTYISVSINICLKTNKVNEVIFVHKSEWKENGLLLVRQSEYAMANIGLRQNKTLLKH